MIILSLVAVLASCSSKKEYMVRMFTTAGVVDMKLYDETPKHRDNFVKLVKEQAYDSLLFHRVIKDFMIQGRISGTFFGSKFDKKCLFTQ